MELFETAAGRVYTIRPIQTTAAMLTAMQLLTGMQMKQHRRSKAIKIDGRHYGQGASCRR